MSILNGQDEYAFERTEMMSSRLRYQKLIVTTALILSGLTFLAMWNGSETVAAWKGHFAALRDIRAGHYLVLGYGFAPFSRTEYAERLHQRYPDAAFVTVAGCVVSGPLQAYVAAYDEYSEKAAINHYGHDVFKEAREEAEKDAQQLAVAPAKAN